MLHKTAVVVEEVHLHIVAAVQEEGLVENTPHQQWAVVHNFHYSLQEGPLGGPGGKEVALLEVRHR